MGKGVEGAVGKGVVGAVGKGGGWVVGWVGKGLTLDGIGGGVETNYHDVENLREGPQDAMIHRSHVSVSLHPIHDQFVFVLL